VDTSRRLPEAAPEAKGVLRFAIGTRISPRAMVEGRQRLAAWLGARLGRGVSVVQRETYAETNDLLARGEVDFALVCSGAFVALPSQTIELLAAPSTKGTATYHSLVLVRQQDPATKFEDLRGRRFAFVDALSLTGRLYPESLARKAGGTFFSDSVYTHSHTESVRMVATARVEAAAVDSLVFDLMTHDDPGLLSRVRVLLKSPAFGSPPIVARRGLDPKLVEAMRTALLQMHEDAQGRGLLVELGFDKFVPVDPRAYESVRLVRMEAYGVDGETMP
jgi:phosphonate transport system substrate-binding protein